MTALRDTDDLRRFDAGAFDPYELAEITGRTGTTIAVCMPARDEAATVGPIVETIRTQLMERVALVDELIVVDDHSRDATARIAADAGARVVDAASTLVEYGTGPGKGGALWKGLYASDAELVVFCDADVRDYSARFVTGLVGPLLVHPDIAFVKGYYERPIEGNPRGGGRVTELVARPLLSLLFPHLAPTIQPLSGEYAGRRDLLEKLPFVNGYGVDLALLVDVAEMAGTESIAQVDLGVRHHRNRGLDELSPQAMAVMATALRRADRSLIGTRSVLVLPDGEDLAIDVSERPPLCELG